MGAAGGQKLRIAQFNLENFFVYIDHPLDMSLEKISEGEWQKHSISIFDNKSLQHLRDIAKCMRDINADIYLLCEVGGVESINNFAKYFLNDEYRAFSIEGNSDRGIDLAYLVRKSLGFKFDLITHKNRALDFLYPHERQSILSGHLNSKHSLRFSRDVLELRVFNAQIGGSIERPCLILLNVHLKSQLDKENIDPQGKDRRKAELEKLVEIYLEISQEFNNQVPVLIAR